MHLPSQSSPSHRLFKVLAVAIALPLIALVPAFLASQLLIQDTVEVIEPAEQAVTIDVTDIDPEGTVMYNISPPNGERDTSDNHITIPHSLIGGSDLIKVTIQDGVTSSYWSDSELSNECSFTLFLRSDDRYDDETDSFTGYLKVTDEDAVLTPGSGLEQLENCGLYLSVDYEE